MLLVVALPVVIVFVVVIVVVLMVVAADGSNSVFTLSGKLLLRSRCTPQNAR